MTEPSRLCLYDAAISGNCHKVRLLLGLLGLEYQRVPVDILAGETRGEAILRLNPRGQVPILVDGETVIWDSQAILAYLARRYGGEAWLPNEPVALAAVMQWLALAENELLYGIARARRVLRLGAPGDLEEARGWGHEGLAVLEGRLADRTWLAGEGPTIADVACYPYVQLAPEAGLELEPYPAVRRWLAAVEALPGYPNTP